MQIRCQANGRNAERQWGRMTSEVKRERMRGLVRGRVRKGENECNGWTTAIHLFIFSKYFMLVRVTVAPESWVQAKDVP